ncbi:MAG TPA: methyltransferase domain-containing protein [Opitutaceae bacterium]|nr:methyltransferase domain-containing protein [Opitutaceae bacterium]HND61461.1 methyltransferase domain-containing protein [Opitutaceae bacterium]
MAQDRNPQAEQMADESMIRNLAAQANAIWPQESALFARYGLAPDCRIADIGCGSGEITARLGGLFPKAEVLGVDILESSVALARSRHAALAPRVQFQQGDAFALDLPTGSFDLVVCRHVTQSIPEPQRVLTELVRITRPGGWVHVLSEDYCMLHFMPGARDPDRFWHEWVRTAAGSMGVDERVGRRTWPMLQALGLQDLRVDYVVVDTVRVPRAVFATIIEAWRDGYTGVISQYSHQPPEEVRAYFDQMIASILDPAQYVVWHVPVLGGRKQS